MMEPVPTVTTVAQIFSKPLLRARFSADTFPPASDIGQAYGALPSFLLRVGLSSQCGRDAEISWKG